jgi:diguanylate cyclase (GGDEF)-like protein
MDPMQSLLALTTSLQRLHSLEEMLQHLVDRTASMLGVARASVRVLDESGLRLLVGARSGSALHGDPAMSFGLGEGLVGWIALHGEALRVADGERDPRFVSRLDSKEPLGSFIGTPLIAAGACIGVLAAVDPKPSYFTEDHATILKLASGLCAPHVQMARLHRLTREDPLTGTLNRRGLDELPESRESSASLSIALIDVDHFKRVNDRYGHEAGDEVLIVVARVLGSVLRRGDAVVRYGGEEFLLVLNGADAERALAIAERARVAVEEHATVVAGRRIQVTISAGVAEREPAEPRDALVRRADAAMYAAKALGRNRVERASGETNEDRAPASERRRATPR